MCVGELVTDDDDSDDRQFMIAWGLWHSTNEPKTTCLDELISSVISK